MELPNRPTKDPYQEIPVKDFSYINTQDKLPKKKNYKPVLIIAGVVLLLLLGGGAYLYGQHTKAKPVVTSKQTVKKATDTVKPTIPNIKLTSYTSAPFNLTVNYPTTWEVASQGTTSMTISSPTTNLVAGTGKTVEGKTVLTVFNQGQVPSAFGANSVAVLNSQNVTFTSPTSSQAAQAYISFVQYPATTVTGGLDAIYITGNNGYVKDQNIPSSDVSQVNPLVIVSFVQCATSDCTSPTPLTISSTQWATLSFSTPILDMIKSFQFS